MRMKVPLMITQHKSNLNSSSWASPASSTTWATTNNSSTKSKSTILLPTKGLYKFCHLTISKHQNVTIIKIWCILALRYVSAKSTTLLKRRTTSGSSWTITKIWSGANNHARTTIRTSNKVKKWNNIWWGHLLDKDRARTVRWAIARIALEIRILTRLLRTQSWVHQNSETATSAPQILNQNSRPHLPYADRKPPIFNAILIWWTIMKTNNAMGRCFITIWASLQTVD